MYSRDLKSYSANFFNASTLSSFSHGKSKSCLPKWPYAAVCSYIGLLKSNILIIPAGLKSKLFLIMSTNSASDNFPVPNVSTLIDVGLATPIAKDNWISHLSASPAATILLAIYLASYAA